MNLECLPPETGMLGDEVVSGGTLEPSPILQSILDNIHGLAESFPRGEISVSERHLLLACFPKSGSSFLTRVLAILLDWPHVPLSYAYERSEQDIYLPNLLYQDSGPTISQHHLRATGSNLHLIAAAGIKVIVLVRDLADTLVSLSDHFNMEGVQAPVCYANDRFIKLPRHLQFDWLIDLAAPWFVHFYVSWQYATREGAVSPLWLTYDDVVKNTVPTLERICTFLGEERTAEQIEQAIAGAPPDRIITRFNKGVAGRGSILTPWQRVRLRRLCSHYSDIDFTPLLGPAPEA
jgi:Sulfotransferase domain